MSEEILNLKFLFPGEFFASSKPYKITTVLGSCVGVTIFNRRLKIGGLNHYLLPGDVSVKDTNLNKYGFFSIKNLINNLLRFDPEISNLEAKIFGGGRVINSMLDFNIGLKNIAIARKILNDYKIPIVCEYVDNNYGLKICFFNYNHQVLVGKINNTNSTGE